MVDTNPAKGGSKEEHPDREKAQSSSYARIPYSFFSEHVAIEYF